MQLSQQEVQRIIQWLENNWLGGQHCPICNHTDWFVNDRVFQLQEYHPQVSQPAVSQPILSVICQHCGHTVFFNAIHVGILNEQGGRHDTK